MTQSTLSVPAHVAVIMDGNGRWAERRGMPRGMGHRAGAEVVRQVVTTAAEAGVETLSLYAFSSDNWKRPAAEVELLMRLFQAHLRSEATRLTEEGVRLEVIGRRDRLPASLLKAIVTAESRTAHGSRMTLRIAVDYSGRYEITRRFTGLPLQRPSIDVDLLIRTGGERRLSDFLLWESAYAELVFTDTLWPDLTPEEFLGHLGDFGCRERRFGGLPGRASA